MEELDLLKTHWKKEENFPKVNKEEIRRMLHKNSSSIVKWILILCLAEFVIGLSFKINFVLNETEKFDILDMGFEILGSVATGYFLVLFFKEYKKIKTFTDTKSLMTSILKARDWVKKYIIVTLSIIGIQSLIGIINFKIYEAFKQGYLAGSDIAYDPAMEKTLFPNVMVFTALLMTFSILALVLFLYYRYVYIRLIERLKKNYDELVSLEN